MENWVMEHVAVEKYQQMNGEKLIGNCNIYFDVIPSLPRQPIPRSPDFSQHRILCEKSKLNCQQINNLIEIMHPLPGD